MPKTAFTAEKIVVKTALTTSKVKGEVTSNGRATSSLGPDSFVRAIYFSSLTSLSPRPRPRRTRLSPEADTAQTSPSVKPRPRPPQTRSLDKAKAAPTADEDMAEAGRIHTGRAYMAD